MSKDLDNANCLQSVKKLKSDECNSEASSAKSSVIHTDENAIAADKKSKENMGKETNDIVDAVPAKFKGPVKIEKENLENNVEVVDAQILQDADNEEDNVTPVRYYS